MGPRQTDIQKVRVKIVTINARLEILTDALLELLPKNEREELVAKLEGRETPEKTGDTRTFAKEYLIELGINPALAGFGGLVSILTLVIERPDALQQLCNIVYPEVAKAEGCKASAVYRNVRTAISDWVSTAPTSKIDELFRGRWLHGTVSNKTFIARVAVAIRKEMEAFGC